MGRRIMRARFLLGGSVVAALFGLLLLLAGNADTANATGLAQGQVVPESVRRDVPVVLDGRVRAHAVVGNRVFVAGDFQQVRRPNGTTITQPYLFAYDINTGALDENFRPVVSDIIRSLDVTEDGRGVYVGGRFTRWDGNTVLRVARIDAQGRLDTGWTPNASGRVRGVVEIGDSVYIGGNFTSIGGVAVTGLAKVDRITGAVDPLFTPDLTGLQTSAIVQALERTPNGSSLFVLHYAAQVDGQPREAVAKFDINGGTPTLSGWNIPWSAQAGNRVCLTNLRDLEISPDGSFLVIGGQGADNPPNCDSVLRYPTGGNAQVNFAWSARMYSSVFSLAVSDVAVYVGGHFCAAPRNGAPPGGVTSNFTGVANSCDLGNPNSPINPSQIDPANAVFRSQMAALNPSNGQALPWDPGSNNFTAVFDLTLTERGLLAGHDRDRFNGSLVGRSGFFDFGGDPVDPVDPVDPPVDPPGGGDCTAEVTGAGNVVVTWNIAGVNTFQVRDNAGWVATVVGANSFTDTSPAGGNPDYVIRTRPNGVVVDVACSAAGGPVDPPIDPPVDPPGAGACTGLVNGAGDVVLNWDIPGETTFQVRVNNAWRVTVQGAQSYTDTNPPGGDASYVIRFRDGGANVDVACEIGGGGPVDPPGADTCAVTVNGAGNVVVTWAIAGETLFQVRDNDGWIATVQAANTFTDTNPGNGNRIYTIRFREAGANVDVSCTPNPINVG